MESTGTQEQSVLTHIEEGVMVIRLNRVNVFNSFNREMAMATQDALRQAASDEQVRCVVITGQGKAFCAGQDLAEAVDPEGPELRSIVKEHYNPMIRMIMQLEKPVVAMVNGVAAGAGANIALACDVVIAAHSAAFIQAFSKIGLIPDSGGTWLLPRLVGQGKAMGMMMLADKVEADEAERLGMIYKSVPDEDLSAVTMKIAGKLAKMPTRGLWLTKKAVHQGWSNSLSDQLDVEEELQTMAGQTHDFNEGVQAFLEKRAPEFKGN